MFIEKSLNFDKIKTYKDSMKRAFVDNFSETILEFN